MPDNWQSVELKHLRALRSIAETGTFWAASEELNTSLSTVSDHVGALETLVGQRLVERSRGRRTVELTDAGRLLLTHADAIESRLRAAEADFRAYAAGVSGGLRIGIYQSVANKVLPEVMRRFKAGWPDVEVQITEGDHDIELVESVERGALDISFAIQPIQEGPFEVRELMRDPHVLVVSAGSAAAWERASVADLAEAPMVGFQHGKHQDITEDFLRGLGVRPRFVFRSNDNGTVQAMVAAGDRKRGGVRGRDARKNLSFALIESPTYERAGGLLGESLSAKRLENRIADFGAADDLRWAVKTAVSHDSACARNHQTGHPITTRGRRLHTVELDGQKTLELALGRKLSWQL